MKRYYHHETRREDNYGFDYLKETTTMYGSSIGWKREMDYRKVSGYDTYTGSYNDYSDWN